MKTVRAVAAVICGSPQEKKVIFATARGYGEFKGQWWEQYQGKETIVIGHTPVRKVKKRERYAKPLFLPNNIIMCDTGAYMEGGKFKLCGCI